MHNKTLVAGSSINNYIIGDCTIKSSCHYVCVFVGMIVIIADNLTTVNKQLPRILQMLKLLG